MNILQRVTSKLFGEKSSLFDYFWNQNAPDYRSGDYAQAYRGWAYACINAIAQEVATMNIRMKRKTSKGDIEVDSHIAKDLLSDVNPLMTSSDLLIATVSYKLLDGNVFWYLPKGKITKKPAEIWVLEPERVTIVKSQDSVVGGYVYTNEKNEHIPLDTNEVIHFKTFHPRNKYRGMGVIEASALAIDTDRYAAEYNRDYFFNSALPSAVLESDGTLSEENFKKIKRQWEEVHAGLGKAHKFAILHGGLKLKPMVLSQKDMDFLEQRKYSRDEILAMFKVPKTRLGMTEGVTVSNAEATDYIFAKTVIKPEMQFIIDRLNEFYLEMFREDPRQTYFTFDDPVPQNVELQLKKWESGINNGYLKRNEVRSQMGLEPVEGGDLILVPFSMVPLSDAASAPADSNPDGTGGKTFKKAKRQPNHAPLRDRFLSKKEKDFKKKLNSHFDTLIKDIRGKKSKSVKKDNKPTIDEVMVDIFPDTTKWKRMFAAMTFDIGADVMEGSVEQVSETYKIPSMTEEAFKRAIDWLKARIEEVSDSVNDTLLNRAREVIARNLAEDFVDIEKIRDEVAETLDQERDWRTERIARTELFTAYAEAANRTYEESGLVEKLKWITAEDERTCEVCESNNNEVRKLGEEFPSGDTQEPAHVSCRCIKVPTYDEET